MFVEITVWSFSSSYLSYNIRTDYLNSEKQGSFFDFVFHINLWVYLTVLLFSNLRRLIREANVSVIRDEKPHFAWNWR